MAKDITKELMEMIRASLPETQVGLIKDALNDRDTLQKKVALQAVEIKQYEEDFGRVQAEASQEYHRANAAEQKAEQLNLDIANLQKQLDEYKLKDIERRAELAEGKLAIVQETQQLFLKNTIVREQIQHQVVDEYPQLQTNYVNGQNVTTSVGTNKVHKGVTDVKEVSNEPENKEGLVL